MSTRSGAPPRTFSRLSRMPSPDDRLELFHLAHVASRRYLRSSGTSLTVALLPPDRPKLARRFRTTQRAGASADTGAPAGKSLRSGSAPATWGLVNWNSNYYGVARSPGIYR